MGTPPYSIMSAAYMPMYIRSCDFCVKSVERQCLIHKKVSNLKINFDNLNKNYPAAVHVTVLVLSGCGQSFIMIVIKLVD